MPGLGKEAPKGNPWQNAERLRKQWQKSFQADPVSALDEQQVETLTLAFERRHVLEHNGGVADERYIKATGERALGRHIRFRAEFARAAISSALAVADRLEATGR